MTKDGQADSDLISYPLLLSEQISARQGQMVWQWSHGQFDAGQELCFSNEHLA